MVVVMVMLVVELSVDVKRETRSMRWGFVAVALRQDPG